MRCISSMLWRRKRSVRVRARMALPAQLGAYRCARSSAPSPASAFDERHAQRAAGNSGRRCVPARTISKLGEVLAHQLGDFDALLDVVDGQHEHARARPAPAVRNRSSRVASP